MNIAFERSYPYLAGLVGLVAGFVHPIFPPQPDQMLSASLTLAAILTGFLATSKTILLGMKGTPVMKAFFKSKYIEDLVSYLAQGIWSSFIFCIVTMVGFFITTTPAYQAVWLMAGLIAGFAFIRITKIFLVILRHEG